MELLALITARTVLTAGGHAFAFSVLTAMEFAFADHSRPQPSLKSRILGFRWWAIYSLAIVLAGLTLDPLVRSLHIRPVLATLAPPGLPHWLAISIAAGLALLLGDLFYYWLHRIEHRFLWRWHTTHHSVRDLCASMAYHHPSEHLWRAAFYTLPMGFFIPYDGYAFPALSSVLLFWGHYVHSNMRLHFGPLGVVFQDNRFHRIHHSLDPRHFDKNFSVMFPVWDLVFGTLYWPSPGEWPHVGLDDAAQPETLGQYLFGPLRHRSVMPVKADNRIVSEISGD